VVRQNFAKTEDAKRKNIKMGEFSYNNKSGTCPYCEGIGVVTLDVQYLPDVVEICPECGGRRYKDSVLSVKWRDKNIADILNLTINEALDVFKNENSIFNELCLLHEIGLGYLKLGESTPKLSGGEAQRLKLATFLKKNPKDYLFIFDEPSIGLHPKDVQTLISVFKKLLIEGATIIVIEHDLDLIANADHIIDMGPLGGKYGGRVVVEGNINQVCANSRSLTGDYLERHLSFFNKTYNN
jgi:excinuclease ABC subunit A